MRAREPDGGKEPLGRWTDKIRTVRPRLLVALALLCLGPPAAAQAAPRLNIVSWNLEWLADLPTLEKHDFWARCKANQFSDETVLPGLPSCSSVGAYGRTAASYEAKKLAPLRQRLAQLAEDGMDVLAVQEVANATALRAVLPSGWSVECFTKTRQAQNLGYAVREAAAMRVDCAEFKELALPPSPNKPGSLRRGLELAVQQGGAQGPRVTLLNVHLKAFCARADLSRKGHKGSEACATLQRQVPVLEAWIERKADANEPFVVLGDWNRDLQEEIGHGRPARTDGSDPQSANGGKRIRYIWPEINDRKPVASEMRLVRIDRKPASDSGCHAHLDQAASSQLLLSKLEQTTLSDGEMLGRLLPSSGASDHCPLRIDLRW
jgi:endonuclease/exonuclease/phosphatase family metal-dependent hydrolase